MKKHGLVVFGWISLGAFASVIGWVVWSLLYPFDVLSVKDGSWTIMNPGKRIARGELAQVYLDYCVESRQSPQMDIRIEQEGRIMLLGTQYPAAAPGCHKSVVPLVSIPKVMALESTSAAGTGRAKLQVHLRYRVNSLRYVQYDFTTDEFIIDP